eukprot:TRINITY_DN2625_c0_g1_i11.p4 TRINITY_DN2625_c0_g1~~TRINITY_DN2625_c0_g1_i11.p4  ORF type:complete len:141 (-),score=18.23 TRINITY_DN2625_c0_g1_i11:412-834(-)
MFAFETHGFQADTFSISDTGPCTITFQTKNEAERLLSYLKSTGKQISVKGQQLRISRTQDGIILNNHNSQNHKLLSQNQQSKNSIQMYKRPQKRNSAAQQLGQNQQGMQQLQSRGMYNKEAKSSDEKIDDGRGVVSYEDI